MYSSPGNNLVTTIFFVNLSRMATPPPVLDDQDQNQTSQASSTIPSETQTLSQSEEVCTLYMYTV